MTERTSFFSQTLSVAQRARALQVAKGLGLFLMAGLLYGMFVLCTGLYLPCPFRKLTGLLCPGCGISHLFVHLMQGELREAFLDNAWVFSLMPLGLIWYLVRVVRYIRTGNRSYSRLENRLAMGLVVGTLVFGVVRNLT